MPLVWIRRPAAVLVLVLLGVTGCTGPAGGGEAGPDPDAGGRLSAELTFDAPDRPELDVPDVRPAGFVAPPPGEGLQRYRDQPLAWSDCEEYQCATVRAPLDRVAPDEQAITLSLLRVPASAEPRLGTLFVNPGGPGGGGMSLATSVAREGLEQYDVVGWDPRGVGASTPVTCFQGEDVDAYLDLDISPDDAAERQALTVANRSFGQSCLERSGPLLQHISSLDTVHDLELLRHLVGDERLNYLGYSYGTYLGALYTELYPDRVGRLVLDAAVNLSDSETVVQAVGFDRALDGFAAWCAGQGSGCALGEDAEAVVAEVVRIFDATDVQPMRTGGERALTQSSAVTGVAHLLYAEESWPALQQALELASDGDGEALLFYADQYHQRGDDGRYGQITFAFPAISCLDHPDAGLDGALELWQQDQEVAPVFGRYFGPDLRCPVWPVDPEPFEGTITGAGAAPVLVVGATQDPATPYEYSVTMAEQLESGHLLTRDGEGHGSYGTGDRCVDEAVVAYLVTGELPEADARCG